MANGQSAPPTYSGLTLAAYLLEAIGVLEMLLGGIALLVGVSTLLNDFQWYTPMCLIGGASALVSGTLVLGLGFAAEALRDIAQNTWYSARK